MKGLRGYITIVCLFFGLGLTAQTSETVVNIDDGIIEAMTKAYPFWQAEENAYSKNLSDIVKLYLKSEAEALTVYEVKKKEREALTDISDWIGFGDIMMSGEEISYYSRIYRLVRDGIIPKTLSVASLGAKDPQKILYWGGLLSDICQHTIQLCQTMETVVLNSELSYRDLPFVRFKDKYSSFLSPHLMGDTTFIAGLRTVADSLSHISKEDIKRSLVSLAGTAAGIRSGSGVSLGGSRYANDSGDYLDIMRTLLDRFETSFDSLVSIKDMLPECFDTLAAEDVTATLFDVVSDDEYNRETESMTGDYLSGIQQTYYTQMWHIEKTSNLTRTRVDYNPAQYSASGTHWIHFQTQRGQTYIMTDDERQRVWLNSSKKSGLSNLDLDSFRRQGMEVDLTSQLCLKSYTASDNKFYNAYAYIIKLVTSQVKNTTVYSELFDSGEESEADFDARMQQVLKDYQKDRNAANSYRIVKDRPQYYTKTSELDVKGMDRANVTVTCSEDVALEESGRQFTSGGDWKLSEDDANGNNEYEFFDDYIPDLLHYFRTGETLIYGSVPKWPGLMEFNRMALESYDIIESQMNAWAEQYGLVWLDELSHKSGSYHYSSSGTATFVRHASRDFEGSDVYTFEVENKFNNDYIYLNGPFLNYGKMRDCQFIISMYLKAHLEESHVYQTLDLSGLSDDQKVTQVNRASSAARSEYPDCKVDVTYFQMEPEDDDSDDTIHLLWSSERLNVAREVEAGLADIYARLVAVERVMRYRLTIKDLALKGLQKLDIEKGMKKSKAEEAQGRWAEAAASVKVNPGN